jgi:hypothetical protein
LPLAMRKSRPSESNIISQPLVSKIEMSLSCDE